jgi:ribosomal protein S18 acetylase RimI-like enzyme
MIRTYEEGDHDQVVALWRRVFPNARPHNDPAKSIALKQREQPELLFVAVDDGRVIGTTMAGYDGHRGWLYHVAVDPDRQGGGIGTQLVRHAERLLAERGCVKVNLQVESDNGGVVSFYKRLGYDVEERVSMGRLLG